jgi:CO/xanthine dehydrogenase FAD-binding subunit
MKPAPFDYLRPASVDEACAMLAAHPDARVISGGQTLVPMMAMRLARPSHLIDVARIPEMRGIREETDAIVMGAATRQAEAENSALVKAKLPLLSLAMPWIGHTPTRNRGTIGGSIANADPAAEIPLVLVTLEGSVTIRDGAKTETIAARDLFLGPMTTALPMGGLLASARFPVWNGERIGVGFHEVSARKSDFAYVSAAAQVELDGAGRGKRIALGLGGATPVPTRLDLSALIGSTLDDASIKKALHAAMTGIEILQDGHASVGYRARVATALAERALIDARANATGSGKARA